MYSYRSHTCLVSLALVAGFRLWDQGLFHSSQQVEVGSSTTGGKRKASRDSREQVSAAQGVIAPTRLDSLTATDWMGWK